MEALVPPDANPFGKRRAEDVLDEQSAHKEQRIEIIHPHHHHHDPSRLVQTGGAPQMVMTTDSMVEEALPLMAGVPQDQAQMAQAQMAQQHVNGMASAMGMDQTLGGGIPNPLIDPNDPAAGGMTLHHPAPEPPQLPSLMRPPPPLPVGRKEGEEVVQVTHKWGEVGDSFKSGKFSKRESELIIAAINDYTTKHDISTDRLCSENAHKGDLRGAWLEIASAVPNRTVQAIYRHGIRKLHSFKRGQWDKEEQEKLVRLVHEKGPKWKKIQEELNRYADACRDKYRELMPLQPAMGQGTAEGEQTTVIPGEGDEVVEVVSNGGPKLPEIKKGRWSKEEEDQLIMCIRAACKLPENTEPMNFPQKAIPWQEVSRLMGGVRSRLHCLNKWSNIRERLEREREGNQLSTAEADMRLLKAILDSGVEEESELVWSRLPHKNAWSRWSKLKKAIKITGTFQEQVLSLLQEESAKNPPAATAPVVMHPVAMAPPPEVMGGAPTLDIM